MRRRKSLLLTVDVREEEEEEEIMQLDVVERESSFIVHIRCRRVQDLLLPPLPFPPRSTARDSPLSYSLTQEVDDDGRMEGRRRTTAKEKQEKERRTLKKEIFV